MTAIQVVFYKEDDGKDPMVAWLEDLQSQPKHRTKCLKWLTLLRDHGYDLKRPKADYLRAGIYELRVKCSFENYRIFYFFHGRDMAVVSHGITKHAGEVPPEEIERALKRKLAYEETPRSRSYHWEP